MIQLSDLETIHFHLFAERKGMSCGCEQTHHQVQYRFQAGCAPRIEECAEGD